MNAPLHQPAVLTTCPYCGVGCGVRARPDGYGGAITTGDPDHPANFGKLCSKGFALGETLGLEGRLLHPILRQPNGTLVRAGWDAALDAVAQGFARIIERDGPDAVAFYLSGQLLTEDYYVANKLMKGFIGSANVDTNSRLCMASSVAGHRRAFGSDTVPGAYEDLDEADLLVLVGSNTAWCHPVLFQRMVKNRRERGARIVVIDPRRTVTGEEADLFLSVAPGMDTALFCGLLAHLADTTALDHAYIDAHTSGFEGALARAREIASDVAATAAATKLPPAEVAQLFEWFRATPRTVTCFSQGVNQSAQGTDKVNAIINCHLATGRIGKLGMGPFSLTGQPNAMGGREVGGLANQLAAHMGFVPDDIDRVRRFWNAPRMAVREGLKAVDMFDAVARGEIKALWVMATNPAVSLPRAGAMRDALKTLELLVVSENVASTDTLAMRPDVVLPAAAWGEKDGTVTNSERRISRQRAFLPLPGEAKPDWWIVSQVARRMGFADAFPYSSAAEVFREHAALSAFENGGTRDFDLGGLAALTDQQFDGLDPVLWPMPVSRRCAAEPASAEDEAKRFFAAGGFFTPDRRARFVAPEPPLLRTVTSENYPLRLNTGRVRDQWHAMARTGLSPSLGGHRPEPFVEIHPEDAAAHEITAGGFAQVTTRHGACTLKVVLSEGQQQGSIFVPIHWSGVTASSARVGDLVGPDVDPFSGQPEAKATPAALAPADFAFRGFVLSRGTIKLPKGTWWSRVAVGGAFGYRLAANAPLTMWRDLAPRLFGSQAILTEYVDRQRGVYRMAAFVEGRLEGCLFVGLGEVPLEWTATGTLFQPGAVATIPISMADRVKSTRFEGESGSVICACFSVGLAAIRDAIVSAAAASTDDVGRALRAGTKCGTCLPELRSIIAREHIAHAH
jgi:assimilatory nitrate reductase catalytic subunit